MDIKQGVVLFSVVTADPCRIENGMTVGIIPGRRRRTTDPGSKEDGHDNSYGVHILRNLLIKQKRIHIESRLSSGSP